MFHHQPKPKEVYHDERSQENRRRHRHRHPLQQGRFQSVHFHPSVALSVLDAVGLQYHEHFLRIHVRRTTHDVVDRMHHLDGPDGYSLEIHQRKCVVDLDESNRYPLIDCERKPRPACGFLFLFL